MKETTTFTLDGLVKVATYQHRSDKYVKRIMFYNEAGEQLVLCVDVLQNCCEDFNYNCDYDENEIVSTQGITMEFISDENFKCICGGAFDINIKGTEKNYNWRISNDHNGYYAHQIALEKTGQYIWKTLI